MFDVSRKRETYGPGGSYALFAGKDASRALGLSSLKPEDAVPDWSTLEEKDRNTLNDWHSFFTCVLAPLSPFAAQITFWWLGNGMPSLAASSICLLPLRTGDRAILPFYPRTMIKSICYVFFSLFKIYLCKSWCYVFFTL